MKEDNSFQGNKTKDNKDNKTRTRVNISGQEYVVKGTYPSSRITHLAKHVNNKMDELKGQNPNLNPTRLAVLTALNLANDYFELKTEYDALVKMIKDEKKK